MEKSEYGANLGLGLERLRALQMLAVNDNAGVSDLVRAVVRHDDRVAHDRARVSRFSHDNDARRRLGARGRKAPPLHEDEIERDVADAVRETRADRADRQIFSLRARRERLASTQVVFDPNLLGRAVISSLGVEVVPIACSVSRRSSDAQP